MPTDSPYSLRLGVQLLPLAVLMPCSTGALYLFVCVCVRVRVDRRDSSGAQL